MKTTKVLKKVFISIFAGLALSTVSAIGVDQNEIKSAEGKEVVFRNYSGPHSVINTIEQIRAIGSELGNLVRDNPGRIGTIGNSNRYAVIHAIDPTTKEKFDADIFIIGRAATVDHITNLRRIISAYLVSAYGYSMKDADTIAAFVTVYNAVYRKNLDYFQEKYKTIVTEKLNASIVGLSTDYEEWPGKTQIVIPLSDFTGVSTVDTSLISDKEVIKSMQDDEDKGIDTRKGMVDIKEREADAAQEKADEKQAQADDEKAKLAAEQKKKAEEDAAAAKAKADADKKKAEADKKQAEADKKQAEADKKKAEAEAAQKKADEAKKAAVANPSDKQAQDDAANAQKDAADAQKDAADAQNAAENANKDADAAQKDADAAQKDADAAQKQADEQTEKTEDQAKKAEQSQKEADEQQAKADQKRDEAQDEREAIAKDQKELLESTRNMEANVMYGLKNVDDAGITSQIIKMNPQNGTVIKESPVSVIRGRTVFEDEKGFIAVAGTNIGNGAVRLVQIDKKGLEIAAESAEKLSELSVLVEQGGNYFCTIQDGNDFYIGKFNNSVQKIMQSNVKVKAATPITVTNAGIMVTDENGQPIILDPTNLVSISPASKADNRNAIQRAGDAAANLIDAK